jgi:hypothetical protein
MMTAEARPAAATAQSRDEFIRRWRTHLAGLALYGVASEMKDGLLVRAGRVLEIPAEVERLLGLMYDGVLPQRKEATPPVTVSGAQNGGAKK